MAKVKEQTEIKDIKNQKFLGSFIGQKSQKEKPKKVLWAIFLLILIAGTFVGYLIPTKQPKTALDEFRKLSMEEQRQTWIDASNFIRGTLAMKGMYNCCLESPCFYCIYKTPKHGEGASCQCRDDILNGVHPCGECIGEILEGHGLSDLAPYFAKAIAEEVGEEHLAELQKIIEEKYGVPVEEQAG